MKRLLAIGLLSVAACATPDRHDAFVKVMDTQVGKKADDPDFYPVFYKLPGGSSKRLANGNQQEEYKAGRNGNCSLFFEIDPDTRTVVGWHADGSDKNCIVGSPYN